MQDCYNLKRAVLVDDSFLGGVGYRGATGHVIEREEKVTAWLLMVK